MGLDGLLTDFSHCVGLPVPTVAVLSTEVAVERWLREKVYIRYRVEPCTFALRELKELARHENASRPKLRRTGVCRYEIEGDTRSEPPSSPTMDTPIRCPARLPSAKIPFPQCPYQCSPFENLKVKYAKAAAPISKEVIEIDDQSDDDGNRIDDSQIVTIPSKSTGRSKPDSNKRTNNALKTPAEKAPETPTIVEPLSASSVKDPPAPSIEEAPPEPEKMSSEQNILARYRDDPERLRTLQYKDRLSQPPKVRLAFDCEWPSQTLIPSDLLRRERGVGAPPALLQLADHSDVGLIRLYRQLPSCSTRPVRSAPPSYPGRSRTIFDLLKARAHDRNFKFLDLRECPLLLDLLVNPSIAKVGDGIDGDVKAIKTHYFTRMVRVEELRSLGERKTARELSKEYFDWELAKESTEVKMARCSDWDAPDLDADQVEYASTDAFMTLLTRAELDHRRDKEMSATTAAFRSLDPLVSGEEDEAMAALIAPSPADPVAWQNWIHRTVGDEAQAEYENRLDEYIHKARVLLGTSEAPRKWTHAKAKETCYIGPPRSESPLAQLPCVESSRMGLSRPESPRQESPPGSLGFDAGEGNIEVPSAPVVSQMKMTRPKKKRRPKHHQGLTAQHGGGGDAGESSTGGPIVGRVHPPTRILRRQEQVSGGDSELGRRGCKDDLIGVASSTTTLIEWKVRMPYRKAGR